MLQTKNILANDLCILLKDDFYPTFLIANKDVPPNELTVLVAFNPIDNIHWYNSNISLAIIPINNNLVDEISNKPTILNSFIVNQKLRENYTLPILWFNEKDFLPSSFLTKHHCGLLLTLENSFQIIYKRKLFDSHSGITKYIQNNFFESLPRVTLLYYVENSAYAQCLKLMQQIYQGGDKSHFLFQIFASMLWEMMQFYSKDLSVEECKKIRAMYTTIAAKLSSLFNDCLKKSFKFSDGIIPPGFAIPVFYYLNDLIKDSVKSKPKQMKESIAKEIKLMDEIFDISLKHKNRKPYSEELKQLIKKHQCDYSVYFYLFIKINLKLCGNIKSSYL